MEESARNAMGMGSGGIPENGGAGIWGPECKTGGTAGKQRLVPVECQRMKRW